MQDIRAVSEAMVAGSCLLCTSIGEYIQLITNAINLARNYASFGLRCGRSPLHECPSRE